MTRKRLGFGFAVAAAVVAAASVAFACTAFEGHMWVEKGTANEGHAIGNGTGMDFCPGTTQTTGDVTRGVGFSVNVAPTSATDPCPNQSLGGSSRGTKFQVLWTTSSGHCMAGTGNKIGTITVKSGTGSGTGYQIPTSATAGPGIVCVSDNAALKGMMVYADIA
jgi:hypothetical protein